MYGRTEARYAIPFAFAFALAVAFTACGRSATDPVREADAGLGGASERCDGADDDRDGLVDEDFRDGSGRYVDPSHCGACGQSCDEPIPNADAVGCDLVDERPHCVALGCAEGFAVSTTGRCVEVGTHACLPCLEDADCGTLPSAACRNIGGELRCTYDCLLGCPNGYTCGTDDYCIPVGNDCRCDGNERFEVACNLQAGGGSCLGRRECVVGQLGRCAALAEVCNGEDDDCDGSIDEAYRDDLGAYSLHRAHCGACGVSCDADEGASLVCGGDPFAPTCVVACADLQDGRHVGDMLDADRRIENGCECQLRALGDAPGPGAGGELDSNCDGADGELLDSYYVATDGSDDGPGSPTRPLRSISVAVERAAASIGTALPRRHVYVATGTYTESVRIEDGVLLHGGYRRDFLARNPEGFEVVVVASSDGDLPGGAAMLVEQAGLRQTLVEGFRLRGRDAEGPGEPAFGLVVVEPGAALVLRDLSVRAGKPGPGRDGEAGVAGDSFQTAASAGAAPRAAIEDGSHLCVVGPANVVAGGVGGANTCGPIDVSGGDGGSPACPNYGASAPSGEMGKGSFGTAGGEGGLGGIDMAGPISGGSSCPGSVCCGLADFYVPTIFPQPEPGGDGEDGESGVAGAACADVFGTFDGTLWMPGTSEGGSIGSAGRGGGGGGAGGGAEMTWMMTTCEFPDGLGGAGGGGGAAGCGGTAGEAGGSGGPSIGVLVVATDAASLPTIEDVVVRTQDGGRGGDGGAGGDGGLGGAGGFGGELPNAARSTPPLAGPLPGERGGKGGNGGAGGAGGGGCGGNAVGIWVTGLGNSPALGAGYAASNTFEIGAGGSAGGGGGGAVAAADGLAGAEFDVLVR